jgi:hypothetical protein
MEKKQLFRKLVKQAGPDLAGCPIAGKLTYKLLRETVEDECETNSHR